MKDSKVEAEMENKSEVRSEFIEPQKVFLRVGEMEKIVVIEFKNMKALFDKGNFKRFCV